MNEQVLFALLRLGLCTSKGVQKERISDLFVYSEKQWEQLEELARFQGVSGIVLDGLQAVTDELGNGCFCRSDQWTFWRKFIIQWIGMVEQGYDAGNMKQLLVADQIQREWAKEGIRMLLVKGLAVGTYYPNPKHRSPGDIDCYLFENYAKGNEVAKNFADEVDEGWYKHSQIYYGGELIENHQFFVHTREGRSSKRLENELLEKLKVEELDLLPGTGILLPPPMFNALFLTYHALTHFLEEGLKLKQLLDWAMFLKRDADKVDWPEFYRICDKYHLRRFADVTTDIAVHYLGVQVNNPQITVNSPYTQKVLRSTLYDKDYVFSSGKGGWTNRWHIVKNLFKYRWKYHEIYQHTIFRQLWFFATGYLFKTQ